MLSGHASVPIQVWHLSFNITRGLRLVLPNLFTIAVKRNKYLWNCTQCLQPTPGWQYQIISIKCLLIKLLRHKAVTRAISMQSTNCEYIRSQFQTDPSLIDSAAGGLLSYSCFQVPAMWQPCPLTSYRPSIETISFNHEENSTRRNRVIKHQLLTLGNKTTPNENRLRLHKNYIAITLTEVSPSHWEPYLQCREDQDGQQCAPATLLPANQQKYASWVSKRSTWCAYRLCFEEHLISKMNPTKYHFRLMETLVYQLFPKVVIMLHTYKFYGLYKVLSHHQQN